MVHSCPECGTALAGKIYDGVTFSECPQCAGVWFFEDDLKHLESENVQDLDAVDLLEASAKPVAAPSTTLVCPMCAGAMQQYHFVGDGPVLVHRCASCEGLWMEHGQLTQMATAVEAAQKPVTAEEIALANNGRPATASSPRIESTTEMAFDQQHDATMAHYQTISSVCRALGHRFFYGGFTW